jgi:flagellar secretion chaperone FliS
VEGASGFGLLIALYDTLAGDLLRAAEAQRNNDIPKRCKEVDHALLVLGYLENWIDPEKGGELSRKLTALYANLRRVLIKAQVKQSAKMLEEQMSLILSIREIWQQLETRAATTPQTPPAYQTQQYHGAMSAQEGRSASSWSA